MGFMDEAFLSCYSIAISQFIEVRMNTLVLIILVALVIFALTMIYFMVISKQEIKRLQNQPKEKEVVEVEVVVPKFGVRDRTKRNSLTAGSPFKDLEAPAPKIHPDPKLRTDKGIDKMKRLNLQPGNHGRVPVTFITDQETGESREFLANANQNLVHRFFGTVLELHGKVLINGLTRRVHQLEIVDGLIYVDGKEYNFHPNDVDNLIKELRDRE